MPYQPVISTEDSASIGRCAVCEGVVFCFIEKYMDDADKAELAQLRAVGGKITKTTVARIGSDYRECRCTPSAVDKVGAAAPAAAAPKNVESPEEAAAKPVVFFKRRLSLKPPSGEA